MSDFKAKMHQIRFPLGLHPRPRWGAYSAPPDPLTVFKGPASKAGKERVSEGKGGRDGRGGERRGVRRGDGSMHPLGFGMFYDDTINVILCLWVNVVWFNGFNRLRGLT